MKAVLQGADGKLCWTDVPDPQVREDQVLLEVHAAALNRADLLQRDGQYPPPPDWPAWFGLEAAGVVRALGKETARDGRWRVGDVACALLGGGGYAEYVAVPTGLLMPVPRGVSMIEAAAIPEAFGAAYLFLFVEAKMQPGETILIQAGASGLASVIIPLAKAFGARVITTVLSGEIASSIGHLGADRIVDTSKERLPDVLRGELEAGRGVDIAIDCLGGADAGRCMPYMNRGGRWIVIASLAGDLTEVDLRSLYARGTRLIGTTLRSRAPEVKAQLLRDMVRTIWPKVESGEVRPTICRTFPIARAEEAQAMMRAGGNVGKIVLLVRESFDLR